MTKQFTLGKKERLKSRKAIEQLFKQGKSIAVAPFKTLYIISPAAQSSTSTLQFGVGVSSRNFKRAVDRNRIKRLTREAYRLQKGELQDVLKSGNKAVNLFLIYNGRELPTYQLVVDKVAVILKRLLKQINENISPNS